MNTDVYLLIINLKPVYSKSINYSKGGKSTHLKRGLYDSTIAIGLLFT